MKNVLILGNTGALGSELSKNFNQSQSLKLYNIPKVDIFYENNIKIITNYILKHKINIIFNCIAFNGYDNCENFKKKAIQINSKFILELLVSIHKYIDCFIHFSSEAVFSGEHEGKIYSEQDIPKPQTVYGQTKLEGEKNILKFKNTLIFRLPLLFGPFHQNQIVAKLLNLVNKNNYVEVATDIHSTPLFAPIISDLFNRILKEQIYFDLLKKQQIYHITSNNYCSLFSLIKLIASDIGKEEFVIPVLDSKFKNLVEKPKFLGLKSDDFNFRFIYK